MKTQNLQSQNTDRNYTMVGGEDWPHRQHQAVDLVGKILKLCQRVRRKLHLVRVILIISQRSIVIIILLHVKNDYFRVSI